MDIIDIILLKRRVDEDRAKKYSDNVTYRAKQYSIDEAREFQYGSSETGKNLEGAKCKGEKCGGGTCQCRGCKKCGGR